MNLPDYVAINFENNHFPEILRQMSKPLSFPLSEEDQKDIKTLEAKYDHEGNCAGLAAPQIGIPKQVIIFAAPDDPSLKKFREDLTQFMDKTIWINPSYEPIGDETKEDYEGCFSVADRAGMVTRHAKIRYTAYNLQGELQEGIAEGFLARVIQHEIDHIHGTLFIDRIEDQTKLFSFDEYKNIREDKINKS